MHSCQQKAKWSQIHVETLYREKWREGSNIPKHVVLQVCATPKTQGHSRQATAASKAVTEFQQTSSISSFNFMGVMVFVFTLKPSLLGGLWLSKYELRKSFIWFYDHILKQHWNKNSDSVGSWEVGFLPPPFRRIPSLRRTMWYTFKVLYLTMAAKGRTLKRPNALSHHSDSLTLQV